MDRLREGEETVPGMGVLVLAAVARERGYRVHLVDAKQPGASVEAVSRQIAAPTVESREARLLNDFQRGMPLVREPFAAIARELATDEGWVRATLARKRSLRQGVVARDRLTARSPAAIRLACRTRGRNAPPRSNRFSRWK